MRPLKRSLATLLPALAGILLLSAAPAQAKDPGDSKSVTVMTWNLYFGFDERPLFLATPDQIPTEVSKAWAAVKKTDFRVRARAIVKQIRSAEPDLIGLQEAVHYDLLEGDFLKLPPTVTGVAESIDFVDILLDELHDARLSYEVASVNLDTDVTLPDAEGTAVRLLDRDVILVRHDRPRGQPSLHVSHPQAGTYAYLLPLCFIPGPDGCALGIDVKRGWASVDVRVADEKFRFVTTHLEDATPSDPPELQGLQLAQAAELAGLIGDSKMPVLLTGDFNSDGSATPPWPAYAFLTTDARLKDAWRIAHPKAPGLTWGQSPDLLNPFPSLTQRIDFVFFRGSFRVLDADVVGDKRGDRASTGLWPSDHAGLVVTFVP